MHRHQTQDTNFSVEDFRGIGGDEMVLVDLLGWLGLAPIYDFGQCDE